MLIKSNYPIIVEITSNLLDSFIFPHIRHNLYSSRLQIKFQLSTNCKLNFNNDKE